MRAAERVALSFDAPSHWHSAPVGRVVSVAFIRSVVEGKPVRVRRGPATVTGDAHRNARLQREATDPPSADREGAEGRPGSQETCLRPQAHKPSWKGVGSMQSSSRRSLPVLAGIVVGLLAALISMQATSLGRAGSVELRVEGSTQTLFEGPVRTEAILNPPGNRRLERRRLSLRLHRKRGTTPKALAQLRPRPPRHSTTRQSPDGLGIQRRTWSTQPRRLLRDTGGTRHRRRGAELRSVGLRRELHDRQRRRLPVPARAGQRSAVGLQLLQPAPSAWSLGSNERRCGHAVHRACRGWTDRAACRTGADRRSRSMGSRRTIPGSPTTDAHGNATIVLAHAGTVTLKATEPESVRSNALTVCVHSGNDGTCGTHVVEAGCPADSSGCGELAKTVVPPPPLPDVASASGVANGHVYSRRRAPRILSGSVEVPGGDTLHEVRIALERRYARPLLCVQRKQGSVRARRLRHELRFFDVGDTDLVQLPAPGRLPQGRYVYDVEAVNDAGAITKLASGSSSVASRSSSRARRAAGWRTQSHRAAARRTRSHRAAARRTRSRRAARGPRRRARSPAAASAPGPTPAGVRLDVTRDFGAAFPCSPPRSSQRARAKRR